MLQRLTSYASNLGNAIMGQSGGSILPQRIQEWIALQGDNSAGVNVDLDTALQVAAVSRSLELTSGVLAELPLEIKTQQNGGRIADLNHELYNTLRYSPNPWTSTNEWVEATLNQMQLLGYSVTLKRRKTDGGTELRGSKDPTELEVTVPRRQEQDVFPEVIVRRKLNGQTLPRTAYILFRHMTINGIVGKGYLHYARDTIGVAKGAQNAFANWLSGGMMAGGIASPKQPLNPTQYQQLLDALRDQRKEDSPSGAQNAGKLWVPPYPLEITPYSIQLREAQMVEAREFQVADIGRFFGVPAHILASEPSAPRANAVAGDLRFVVLTLMPLGKRFCNALHRQLLDGDPTRSIEFDYSSLLRGDRLTEARIANLEVTTGVSTPNEARNERGRPDLPGDEGKQSFVPANTRPLGADAQPTEPTR